MTDLERDVHVVRNNDGSIQATLNGEPVDPSDPRVQHAVAQLDQTISVGGFHSTQIATVTDAWGTHVNATRDGQAVDPSDSGVQATISEMQKLARENAEHPKKKRFFFKFKLGS